MPNLELDKVESYILFLLYANQAKPIRGKLWLQKAIFLMARGNKAISQKVEFHAHHLGPYSEEVDAILDQLEVDDFIQLSNNKISLTSEGSNIVANIEKDLSEEEKKHLCWIKETINDLDSDELLALVYFSYPEYTEYSIEIKNLEKKRDKLAIQLYKKQKITLIKATKIANISISDFQKLIKKEEK